MLIPSNVQGSICIANDTIRIVYIVSVEPLCNRFPVKGLGQKTVKIFIWKAQRVTQ